MQIELSPEAVERIEGFVESGVYPSAAAVLDAALDALEIPIREYTSSEIAELVAPARKSVAAGRARPAEEVVAEMRALVAAKVRNAQRG